MYFCLFWIIYIGINYIIYNMSTAQRFGAELKVLQGQVDEIKKVAETLSEGNASVKAQVSLL